MAMVPSSVARTRALAGMPRRYSTPAKVKADSSSLDASRNQVARKPDRGSRPGSSQPIRTDWQGVRSPRRFNQLAGLGVFMAGMLSHALRGSGRTLHDALDHHGRDARAHGLGPGGRQYTAEEIGRAHA